MIERFRVAPGSVTAVQVFGGDRLEVIDHHGRQPAELTVLASDPRAVVGARPDAPATVLRRLVGGPDENGYAAGRILKLLSRHRIDQGDAVATRLFDEGSAAGARARFAIDNDAVVLVAAPAAPMRLSADDPNPPSEVVVEVRRADPSRPEPQELPQPLAEPLWDMHIDASTASS
ncbi:MAG: aminomethyltransferase, partial [Mycobacterium sp.]|nr:aminomethyltransferase [Mycobacterium sp.]